jgi:hypothetical protein
MPRDQAQVLYVWVRNQNSRLRTLAIARDMRLDLLPGRLHRVPEPPVR